jgi:hypothetical protein
MKLALVILLGAGAWGQTNGTKYHNCAISTLGDEVVVYRCDEGIVFLFLSPVLTDNLSETQPNTVLSGITNSDLQLEKPPTPPLLVPAIKNSGYSYVRPCAKDEKPTLGPYCETPSYSCPSPASQTLLESQDMTKHYCLNLEKGGAN